MNDITVEKINEVLQKMENAFGFSVGLVYFNDFSGRFYRIGNFTGAAIDGLEFHNQEELTAIFKKYE